jgi:hypothetical protein
MMQPSASPNLIQFMEDKMKIRDSTKLNKITIRSVATLLVKKKLQLKMFLVKILCKLRKSFQQF